MLTDFANKLNLGIFFRSVTTDNMQKARGENGVTMFLWCIIHLFLT